MIKAYTSIKSIYLITRSITIVVLLTFGGCTKTETKTTSRTVETVVHYTPTINEVLDKARAHLMNKEYMLALETLKSDVHDYQSNAAFHYFRAFSLYELKLYAKASESIYKCLDIEQNNALYWTLASKIEWFRKDWSTEKTDHAIEEAKKIDPKAFVVLDWISHNALLRENYSVFEQASWKAIELYPKKSGFVYTDLGKYYQDMGESRLDSALYYYDLGIASEPMVAKALYGRGVLYARKNNLELAMADMETLIELNLELVPAHTALCYAHVLRKDYAKAREHGKTALQIDPNHEQAQINLGYAYFNDGRYNQACEIWSLVDATIKNQLEQDRQEACSKSN